MSEESIGIRNFEKCDDKATRDVEELLDSVDNVVNENRNSQDHSQKEPLANGQASCLRESFT